MTVFGRLQHAWNAFRSPEPKARETNGSYFNESRQYVIHNVSSTIVNSIYNRIAVDASSVKMFHAKVDQNGGVQSIIRDELDDRLNYYANNDQTGKELIRDIVFSMCCEGYIAVCPLTTKGDPTDTEGYKIQELRVGKIVEWYPYAVKVNIYDQEDGQKKDIIMLKKNVAIIENPFYETMNEPTSALQRLIKKLNLLDKLDSALGSDRLNIILKNPYPIRGEARRQEAKNRVKEIEMQLKDSAFGIGYIDGTENIIQLNQPPSNTIYEQIKDLTKTVYDQIGVSDTILAGTADEQTMINYFDHVIDPFMAAITQAFNWKFISQTAYRQGHRIYYFRDPFRLVPSEKLAELADKFTRNEIVSPNEFRAVIGLIPSDDPKANELRNRNLNENKQVSEAPKVDTPV